MTADPRVRPGTVADLVEGGARRHPTVTAVVAGDESLTYAELDAESNRLAHHLQSLGVGPDVSVAVCMERSLDLAVALLAVIKAGGACVPLDPSYPQTRLAFMVDDSAATVILTGAAQVERLPGHGVRATQAGHGPVIRVDADAAAWASRPSTPPPRATGSEHLGYVIYTSGSTGRPKGVMLTHRGLVNHHRAAVDLYRLGPGDRVLQFCSIGFDASIEELFPTWASGATLVFRPDDAPLLGRAWRRWVDERGITVLNLPTAYWHEWAHDLEASGEGVPDRVRLVVVGGEKALGPAYRTWERVSGGRSRWINVYGPTETTCMSTFYEPPPGGDDIGEKRDPPIGRPLPGTTVRVVDDNLRPVAVGVTGELLIGGAGLARGYLNHPQLTAERFVAYGFGEPTPARMYRTGDLVRLLDDGDLDFVGRIDDQVKIRGFRIECGEVEATLARHPDVAEAVVVAREDRPGEKQLAGYVVATSATAVTSVGLRRFLAERLPAHMVPTTFTVLDTLPLTSNGKVDRAALPTPARAPGRSGRSPSAPRSPVEQRVAEIWARVLGLPPADVDRDDDFFQLGGHSLLATQVIAQVREELGTETPLRALFEAPTVAALAAVVEAESAVPAAAPPLVARPRRSGTRLPLSIAQEQMWALETAATPPGLYNVTALHWFDPPVDEGALRAALAYMVERHESLRTGIAVDAGRPYQFVVMAADVDLTVTDLQGVPPAGREQELQRRIAEQDATPFDPAQPPLLRVGLFHVDARSSRLAVTFDHLVCDGPSATIFMTELLAAYGAMSAHRMPSLAPLTVQFADFALWQRAHVTDEVLRRQLDWWAKALQGMPLGPAVPFDHLPVEPTRRISSRPIAVGAGTRAVLEQLARATASTVFIVAVAAAQAVFSRHGGTTDVVVTTTLSGRSHPDLEGLIGMFAGIGRVRTDLSGDPPFTAVAARARDWVLDMFDNQDVPFMRVRKAVLPDFPTGGLELAAALPVDFQYFRIVRDQELFFRGQLHPLNVTLLDDGTEISGELRYKVDFYDPATIDRLADDLERVLAVVGRDPSVRLSELPVSPPAPR